MLALMKKSIAANISIIQSMVVIIGILALMYVQYVISTQTLSDQFVRSHVEKTELLSVQMAGGIKWKKVDAIKKVYQTMAENKESNLAALYVTDGAGTEIDHYNDETITKVDLPSVLADPSNKTDKPVSLDTDDDLIRVVPVLSDDGKPFGYVVAAWSKSNNKREIAANTRMVALVAAAVIIFMIFVTVLSLKKVVVGPLVSIQAAMSQLAKGEMDIKVPYAARVDEIGQMAQALEVFKETAAEREMIEADRVQQQALERKRAEAIHGLARSFDTKVTQFLGQLDGSVRDIQATSESLDSVSSSGSNMAVALSRSSSNVAANVQTVASAAEELSSSIVEISSQIQRSNQLVSSAVDETDQANALALKLNGASERISIVTNLIADIASQINLLALNATIEAARAGEAGKGFAVVAGEVKNLATQTDSSASEIQEVVATVQEISQSINKAFSGIRLSIDRVRDASSSIAAAVEEQSATTSEIARNMGTAVVDTQEVSSGVTDLADGAQQTKVVADTMKKSATVLGEQAQVLKAEVGQFLEDVKNA